MKREPKRQPKRQEHPFAPGLCSRRLAIGVALGLAAGSAAAQRTCAAFDEDRALQQVNAVRARGAVCGAQGAMSAAAALVWNAQLHLAAQRQAQWLAERGALAHSGPNGETLGQRARAAGYDYSRIAENVAKGQSGVPQVLAGWTASEGHCVNLYDGRLTEMALACVVGGDGRNYWALLLGRP